MRRTLVYLKDDDENNYHQGNQCSAITSLHSKQRSFSQHSNASTATVYSNKLQYDCAVAPDLFIRLDVRLNVRYISKTGRLIGSDWQYSFLTTCTFPHRSIRLYIRSPFLGVEHSTVKRRNESSQRWCARCRYYYTVKCSDHTV